MSPRARIAALLIVVAMAAAATAVAAPRLHRTKLPPPPGAALPTSLAVDEREWAVIPSKRTVAAGPVTIRVYNRGMDDHDLSLIDAAGTLHRVYLEPGHSDVVTASLTPGVWRLWCSLFEGTPASHAALGMETTIEVRPEPILSAASPG
ncbi:MAG: hypothetical protein AB7V42_00595 [Thermoleophilia bacterium]